MADAEAHEAFDEELPVGERPFEARWSEELLLFGQAAAEEPTLSHRAMSTRRTDRAGARGGPRRGGGGRSEGAQGRWGAGGGLGLPGLGFGKPKRRDPSAMGAALMISGGAAVLNGPARATSCWPGTRPVSYRRA